MTSASLLSFLSLAALVLAGAVIASNVAAAVRGTRDRRSSPVFLVPTVAAVLALSWAANAGVDRASLATRAWIAVVIAVADLGYLAACLVRRARTR